MLRPLLALLALIAGAAALSAQTTPGGGVTVVEPWARATPAGAKVGAAYMQLKAAAGAADKLVAAAVDPAVAGVVEIHNHIMEGGVARMRRVEAIPVPAGGSVALAPGGYHVMLMELKSPLKAGDSIRLKLRFEKAGEIEVEAKVRPIGAPAGKGSGSHHGH